MTSIGALGGDCTIPGWAVRPGAVSALRPAGEGMLLWQMVQPTLILYTMAYTDG